MYPMCPDRDPALARRLLARPAQRAAAGFVLPSAIFLIVVMAALAAYMVRTFTLMRGSFDLSYQGVNAYQAALAGLEWGNYQALDPNNTYSGSGNLPSCPATTTLTGLVGSLAQYSVQVSCQGGGATQYTEGNHYVAVYRFTAVASTGTAGTTGYIERDAQSLVTLCKDPSASTYAYKCH